MSESTTSTKKEDNKSAATTPDKKESTANKTKASAALQKDLEAIIKDNYELCFKEVKEFDDFYHALHEIIEKLSESKGAMQLKLPSKADIKKAYKRYSREGEVLLKEEFKSIVKEVITLESFSMGRGALETIFVIFGVPICAFFLKRYIPGAASVSDDVVIPVATSGTVVLLAATNKL